MIWFMIGRLHSVRQQSHGACFEADNRPKGQVYHPSSSDVEPLDLASRSVWWMMQVKKSCNCRNSRCLKLYASLLYLRLKSWVPFQPLLVDIASVLPLARFASGVTAPIAATTLEMRPLAKWLSTPHLTAIQTHFARSFSLLLAELRKEKAAITR